MEVPGRKQTSSKTILLCQPCRSYSDSLPAEGYCETCKEYFCSACLKVHRKQSATKNHVIKLKDEMPTVQAQTDPCSELCDVHKTEIVKYYCEDHDEVACGDCIILHHKTCSVQLVSDASDDYDVIGELWAFERKIRQILYEFRSCKDEIQCNIKAATEIYTKAFQEIKHFREKLNRYLDNAEGEILKEIEILKSQDISFHSKLQNECLSMEKEIAQFREALDKNEHKTNNLFVTAKLVQKRLEISQEVSKRILSECRINSYMFEPSTHLLTFQANKPPFGRLSSWAFREQGNAMNVQTAHERNCFITGIAEISCNEILLADFANRSLKILNVKIGKITSKYRLHTNPWDVTVISRKSAAATLPEEGKILFMNTKNGLSESHSLTMGTNCQGIDHHNDHIAVCFSNPSVIQILTMAGDVINEVRDTGAFGWLGHLVWNKTNTNIYVSDYWQRSVYELHVNGNLQVKATLKNEEWRRARGLAVVKNGTVAVCCEGNNNRLHLTTPDTRATLPLTLSYVQKPVSVFVCEEQSKMYVSSHFSAQECNVIKLFDVEFKQSK